MLDVACSSCTLYTLGVSDFPSNDSNDEDLVRKSGNKTDMYVYQQNRKFKFLGHLILADLEKLILTGYMQKGPNEHKTSATWQA